MRFRSWCPRLGALGMLAALVAFAPEAPAADLAAEIAAGDAAHAAGNYDEALARYQAALALDARDFGTLWRLARVESERGEDAKGEEQRRFFSDGVAHARDAARVAPDSAVAHVWLAVALGRQARREGPRTKLALAREIKSEVDRAIALDPSIGRAWHVRAAWNRELASLNAFERMAANAILGGVPKGATLENAVADFRHAIELEPAYVNHRLELGRTLIQLKRKAEARAELERAITLPPTSSPRDPRYQQEARDLLARLKS